MNPEYACELRAAGAMPRERAAFVSNLSTPGRQLFATFFGWYRAITKYAYANAKRGSCGFLAQKPHSRVQEVASPRIDACELCQTGIRFDAQRA